MKITPKDAGKEVRWLVHDQGAGRARGTCPAKKSRTRLQSFVSGCPRQAPHTARGKTFAMNRSPPLQKHPCQPNTDTDFFSVPKSGQKKRNLPENRTQGALRVFFRLAAPRAATTNYLLGIINFGLGQCASKCAKKILKARVDTPLASFSSFALLSRKPGEPCQGPL